MNIVERVASWPSNVHLINFDMDYNRQQQEGLQKAFAFFFPGQHLFRAVRLVELSPGVTVYHTITKRHYDIQEYNRPSMLLNTIYYDDDRFLAAWDNCRILFQDDRVLLAYNSSQDVFSRIDHSRGCLVRGPLINRYMYELIPVTSGGE